MAGSSAPPVLHLDDDFSNAGVLPYDQQVGQTQQRTAGIGSPTGSPTFSSLETAPDQHYGTVRRPTSCNSGATIPGDRRSGNHQRSTSSGTLTDSRTADLPGCPSSTPGGKTIPSSSSSSSIPRIGIGSTSPFGPSLHHQQHQSRRNPDYAQQRTSPSNSPVKLSHHHASDFEADAEFLALEEQIVNLSGPTGGPGRGGGDGLSGTRLPGPGSWPGAAAPSWPGSSPSSFFSAIQQAKTAAENFAANTGTRLLRHLSEETSRSSSKETIVKNFSSANSLNNMSSTPQASTAVARARLGTGGGSGGRLSRSRQEGDDLISLDLHEEVDLDCALLRQSSLTAPAARSPDSKKPGLDSLDGFVDATSPTSSMQNSSGSTWSGSNFARDRGRGRGGRGQDKDKGSDRRNQVEVVEQQSPRMIKSNGLGVGDEGQDMQATASSMISSTLPTVKSFHVDVTRHLNLLHVSQMNSSLCVCFLVHSDDELRDLCDNYLASPSQKWITVQREKPAALRQLDAQRRQRIEKEKQEKSAASSSHRSRRTPPGASNNGKPVDVHQAVEVDLTASTGGENLMKASWGEVSMASSHDSIMSSKSQQGGTGDESSTTNKVPTLLGTKKKRALTRENAILEANFDCGSVECGTNFEVVSPRVQQSFVAISPPAHDVVVEEADVGKEADVGNSVVTGTSEITLRDQTSRGVVRESDSRMRGDGTFTLSGFEEVQPLERNVEVLEEDCI
ncbi:unnamed protein product [Amoebophrya sp. A25]|nr:unnamed protein product [Amoebophrya sp. A25]|eukprot:GSA25T00018434001.1